MQTKSTAIEANLTVEEAFARVLQNNLASVQKWAPVALRGEDIEGVHQMRVCLRRMRSALTVFRSAILRKIAKKHRQEAYTQVEELIKGRRYSALCEGFNDWIEARKWCENISAVHQNRFQENITPFASRVLEEHRSIILEHGKEIDQLDDETLHKLRIECKKLRYATEFFTPLLWRPDEIFYRAS